MLDSDNTLQTQPLFARFLDREPVDAPQQTRIFTTRKSRDDLIAD